MTKKKSFLIYHDQQDVINMLKDEEAGRLFKDLFASGKDHTVPDYSDNRVMAVVFQTFKEALNNTQVFSFLLHYKFGCPICPNAHQEIRTGKKNLKAVQIFGQTTIRRFTVAKLFLYN